MLKTGAIKKAYGHEGYVKCVLRGDEIWREWLGYQAATRADALAAAVEHLDRLQQTHRNADEGL